MGKDTRVHGKQWKPLPSKRDKLHRHISDMTLTPCKGSYKMFVVMYDTSKALGPRV